MLDSINFKINGVARIDKERLADLQIVYYKFKYKQNNFGKYCMEYGDVKENETNIISTGIEFEYKDIFFQFYENFKCVVIIANVHKVLKKQDILLSDRDDYINKVNQAICEILDISQFQLNFKLDLHRFDYCVDLELDYDLMYEYLHLLEKHKSVYQHIKRINEYETSIYLTSKNGQKRINIYDKYQCEKDKYFEKYNKAKEKMGISLAEYKEKHPPYYEYYLNIFRIEIQNTKVLIQKESRNISAKYKKNSNSIIPEFLKQTAPTNPITTNKMHKNLYGYWNKESMNKYFFKFLKDYLYMGTYYKLKIAKRMIKKSTELAEIEKIQLIEFITAVNKYGITGVTKTNSENDHQMWCGATVSKYIDNLQQLGISIVQVDSNKNFDLKSAKAIIDKSSHTDNLKSKLYEFLKVVKKYGVANVIASNNNQIVNNNKNCKHKMWCSITVDKYIKKLEKLGINPVTLDNNSKFDSLESLYTLAEKVAKEKYFDVDKLDIPMPPIPPKIRVRRRKLGGLGSFR